MPLKQITNFLKQTNELKTAELLLDTFSKYARDNTQFDELAQLYYETKCYVKSAKYAEKALILSKTPQEMYVIRSNLGKVYNYLNQPKKALKYLEQNLFLNPKDLDARMEKNLSLYMLGDEKQCYDNYIEMSKEDLPDIIKHRVNFNLATYEMEFGDYKKGLASFNVNGKLTDVFRTITPPNNIKEWDGIPKIDKKLLIIHRGGIGDEIINIRFMKNLKDLGMKPVWWTSFPDLKTVFNRNGFDTISNISELKNIHEYEFCSSMELPYLLNLDVEELGRTPYIKPDPEYVEKYKHIDGIGIKWAGNKDYEQDLHRTIPVEQLINTLNNYNIYSLQKEDYQEIEKYNAISMYNEMETIEDTLGIIVNLEFVVTSCTSIAHMCAAMGTKVYVIPPIACYYTWLGRTDDKSYWYDDNCTVIRQTKWNNWTQPLEKLKSILER